MMDENIYESAEIQEVAEPAEAEDSEVTEDDDAEEDNGRTEMDAAFAEMRRNNQRLEREAELMRSALSRYFEGETAEELSDNAIAYADDRDPDEYRAEREQREEFEELRAKNETLENTLLEMEVDRLMREGLREIQEINPNIKSLDELGEPFARMIGAGLPTKEAYYATLAMEGNEKVHAPDPIGRVSDNRVERDYYTSEEIDNLTDEELANDEIYEKVIKSMERLYGK